RLAGTALRAAGRQRDGANARPRAGGHEHGPVEARGGGPLSEGLVLPPQRSDDHRAAVARAPRRRGRAGTLLPVPFQPPTESRPAGYRPGSLAPVGSLQLAGQRAPVTERDPGRDAQRLRPPHLAGIPLRAPPAGAGANSAPLSRA